MYRGKCEEVLKRQPVRRRRGKFQLLFTSPPFPLNRKKRYGNRQGQEYLEWLASLAPLFREQLTENGSIAIELGNAWERGAPTTSTLPIKALLAFQEAADLHLCQEFVCYNPAKLPTPAEWVTVRRIRVKDAFTRVWWMSPTENPKADNRQVLTEYSSSMQQLLERGTYNPGIRPSEHNIGKNSFLSNNGGAIPPNVIVPSKKSIQQDLLNLLPIANTQSNDPYQEHCRKKGLRPHPARMPTRLVEFFIRFLTDPNDLVLDPFAGSNTTGYVAEQLGRRWVSIEADRGYVRTSKGRFRTRART
jgi:site-specific DNA-methyltransferase (cytosine-N4-specific)